MLSLDDTPGAAHAGAGSRADRVRRRTDSVESELNARGLRHENVVRVYGVFNSVADEQGIDSIPFKPLFIGILPVLIEIV